MTYVLEIQNELETKLLYKGRDHHAALIAAAEELQLDAKRPDEDVEKIINIQLSCLSFQEDCSWDLRLTDGTVTKIVRKRQPEIIIP